MTLKGISWKIFCFFFFARRANGAARTTADRSQPPSISSTFSLNITTFAEKVNNDFYRQKWPVLTTTGFCFRGRVASSC